MRVAHGRTNRPMVQTGEWNLQGRAEPSRAASAGDRGISGRNNPSPQDGGRPLLIRTQRRAGSSPAESSSLASLLVRVQASGPVVSCSPSRIGLTYGGRVENRYHGTATISQGAAVVEGDCIIESVGGPAPGPDPAWSGRLQEPAPTMKLIEGGAWLRLADGRECEIRVERAVAGSGTTEFSGAKGILDLR
jgi:hypothetical protein